MHVPFELESVWHDLLEKWLHANGFHHEAHSNTVEHQPSLPAACLPDAGACRLDVTTVLVLRTRFRHAHAHYPTCILYLIYLIR